MQLILLSIVTALFAGLQPLEATSLVGWLEIDCSVIVAIMWIPFLRTEFTLVRLAVVCFILTSYLPLFLPLMIEQGDVKLSMVETTASSEALETERRNSALRDINMNTLLSTEAEPKNHSGEMKSDTTDRDSNIDEPASSGFWRTSPTMLNAIFLILGAVIINYSVSTRRRIGKNTAYRNSSQRWYSREAGYKKNDNAQKPNPAQPKDPLDTYINIIRSTAERKGTINIFDVMDYPVNRNKWRLALDIAVKMKIIVEDSRGFYRMNLEEEQNSSQSESQRGASQGRHRGDGTESTTLWPAYYTHFDVLGIPSTSSRTEIKRAYRRLAKIHHPDRGGDIEKFFRLTEAYRGAVAISDE
jgi:hypothetical protein